MPPDDRLLILMADDDDDDCFIAEKSLEESGISADLTTVEDGIKLIDYLSGNKLPDIILLDLNMPRKDGYEVLVEIKSNPSLNHIPVIVLTTSHEEKDISFARGAGATAFKTKPPAFSEWVNLMKSLTVIVSGN